MASAPYGETEYERNMQPNRVMFRGRGFPVSAAEKLRLIYATAQTNPNIQPPDTVYRPYDTTLAFNGEDRHVDSRQKLRGSKVRDEAI